VEEILNETELRGTVMNSKKLGERKNGNLPGVKVDIPVLTDKDINDLQNFGCKKGVDFIAASFVQSKEDVLFIRKARDRPWFVLVCAFCRPPEGSIAVVSLH
jgi:pyruvate kinase